MPFIDSWPKDASVWDVFRADLRIYTPFIAFTEALMRGPSSLSVPERELIAAYVSRLNSCEFCYGGHSAAAAELGVDPDLFDELFDDLETAPVDDAVKPILRLVRKLTRQPSHVVQADVDAVFEAGWDEKAYRDAVAICAYFNYMNRIADGFGIEDIPDRRAAIGRGNARFGYASRFKEALANEGYPGLLSEE